MSSFDWSYSPSCKLLACSSCSSRFDPLAINVTESSRSIPKAVSKLRDTCSRTVWLLICLSLGYVNPRGNMNSLETLLQEMGILLNIAVCICILSTGIGFGLLLRLQEAICLKPGHSMNQMPFLVFSSPLWHSYMKAYLERSPCSA